MEPLYRGFRVARSTGASSYSHGGVTAMNALRKGITGLVVAGALAVAGAACTSTASAERGKAPAHSQAATHSSPKPSTPKSTSALGTPLGVPIVVKNEDGGQANVTVNSVTFRATSADPEFGSPPKNGRYAVVSVTYDHVKGKFDFNPFDFLWQAPDGTTYDGMAGNASFETVEPVLDSGTLSTGQVTKGNFVLDVPTTPTWSILYTTPLGERIGSWQEVVH